MPDIAKKLRLKIDSRDASVGVIGLGYVGLPAALAFAEEKFCVIGFDIDESKVEMLARGESYIQYVEPVVTMAVD